MKGVLLAGGTGSRLYPLTKVTNKHLLPVYNKPMIYYPLFTMKRAGITEVLIVSGKGHAGSFLELLGSGAELGLKIAYEVQDEAGGIAQALALAESFVRDEKMLVTLGDNVFEDDISEAVANFEMDEKAGARIFLKSVENPSAYGVAEVVDGEVVRILEKPSSPPSDLAVVGCYMYDARVFEVIRGLKPSGRGELEITDVNSFYLNEGSLKYSLLEGFWGDCGESFDSLSHAAKLVQGSYLASVSEFLRLDERERGKLELKNEGIKELKASF